jgi:hypothetical protein
MLPHGKTAIWSDAQNITTNSVIEVSPGFRSDSLQEQLQQQAKNDINCGSPCFLVTETETKPLLPIRVQNNLHIFVTIPK